MKLAVVKIVGAVALGVAVLATTNAQAQEKKKVTYAIATADLNVGYPFATLPIALGYYAEEGLDVTVVPGQSSAATAQLLISGRADIGMAQPDPVVIQKANANIPLVSFYAEARHGTNRVIVLPDSPIKGLADLKGKKVGVNDLGSGGVVWLKGRLKEIGIGPADVQLIGVGYGTPSFEALKNGTVDAEVNFTGGIARQINAGYPVRQLPMTDADKAAYSYNMFATQAYIDANPDVIAKMGRATAKATIFLMTNPEAAVHIFWKQYPDRAPKDPNDAKQFTQDLAIIKAQIVDMAADELPITFQWGSQSTAVYKQIQQFYVEAGQIKTPIDPASFYTSKFEAEYTKFDPQKIADAAKAYK